MLLAAASILPSCTAPQPVPTPPPAADPAELCAQFGDVQTIVFNAGAAQRDGRMTQQEHDGWLRLAARVLSRIEADPSTDVGAAIAAAQAAAPAVPLGQADEPFDPLSSAWSGATAAVRDACAAAGAELVIEGFTGG